MIVAAGCFLATPAGNAQQQSTPSSPPEKSAPDSVDEANDAIAKAVTDQGLSIDEYVSIMKTAQNDPAVCDKLVQRLK
jgi:hypothetical protein